jgi:hypothetical protein
MQTIVNVMPIAQMSIVVGDGNGDGGRGNNYGGFDASLQCCSNAGRRLVCGQGWDGWQQRFCGNCHAVKIRSRIKLKPKTLIFRHLMQYYSSVWA